MCDEIYTHWINSVTSITLAIVIWYLDNLHNRKYRHLWWEENITEHNGKDIRPENNSVDLETDASNSGWEPNLNGKTTGDRWLDYGSAQHINFLEGRAVKFALQSLCQNVSNIHICLRSDNSTAVSLYQ